MRITSVSHGFRALCLISSTVASLCACGGGAEPLTLSMFSPITAEATSPAGATVTVPAPSANDPAATVSCAPASGAARFPIGVTTVTCTAANASGDVVSGTSSVQVVDTTPPVLTLFAPITVPATDPGGATVDVPAAMATDIAGVPTVNCPHGAARYPVGSTAISCSAVDGSGNATSASSSITVLPFVPAGGLKITMFAPITVEATGPDGALVNLPSATTNDPSATVSCNVGAGPARFPLGTTVVTCEARDGAGPAVTGTSSVQVVDTTPPVLTMFAPITVPATDAAGAVVNVPAVTATDVTGAPVVACPSGPARYPIGTTPIACTAKDAAGNVASGNSSITVTPLPTAASAFRAIAAGLTTTCALALDGTPYCWGAAGPLLGRTPAPTTPQLTPQPVQTSLKFVAISISSLDQELKQTACAVAADGSAYCWGNNSFGQLGDGTTTHRVQPTAVAGGHHFVSIDTHADHSCALDDAGAVWCWGANANGELGNGDTNGATQLAPVQVQAGARLVQISVGGQGACALTDTQAVLCWGHNEFGELGIGSVVPFASYSPRSATGLPPVKAVVAGEAQRCALSTDGTAWCWGGPAYGAIGDGRPMNSATPVTTPVRVSGGLRFAGLGAGFQATCGWTMGMPGSDGSSACWGFNGEGRLGDGSTTDRGVPVAVVGAPVFTVIRQSNSSFLSHACGLTATGQAWCWGSNSSGQLGDGSTNQHHTPGPVTMP